MPAKPEFKEDWNEAAQGIVSAVFDLQAFVSATFTLKAADAPAMRVRAVEIKGEPLWQFSEGSASENLPRQPASRKLRDFLLSQNVHEAHVLTADKDYHYRVTKKGRVLFAKGAAPQVRDPAAARAHDKTKDHPLARFDSALLLRATGLADESGLKPSMTAKYRQVNEFLREIAALMPEGAPAKNAPDKAAAPGQPAPRVMRLCDVGCGKAYLSFCAKAFLEAANPGLKIHLSGIDINEGVIASCRRIADAMGWGGETGFAVSDIAAYKAPAAPDIVLSLHACDTATDEALAFGIENNASLILCAPCCQHELQSRLAASGKHRPLLRNAILRERFADILTDTFRAQLLRVAGYKTTVVEFVSPDSTARNILIKAVRVRRGGTGDALAEYHDLVREWDCEPYLARRLAARFPELAAIR